MRQNPEMLLLLSGKLNCIIYCNVKEMTCPDDWPSSTLVFLVVHPVQGLREGWKEGIQRVPPNPAPYLKGPRAKMYTFCYCTNLN